ncbi:MAG: TonB-dependent receptor [Desulfobacteraceae bacterium]|jgi:iron complex outermembrane receptor protein
MKKSKRVTLFEHMFKFLLIMGLTLECGTAIGQENNKEDEGFMLEEITVTAQFRKTDLQKTPISISAVTGEMLEEQNILSVRDLGLIVPNANIRQTGNWGGPNAQIGLRGVDQYEYVPAFEPGVGVYVDDIYHGTLTGSTMDLLDLERVEVLRGPQGTLFGKNSLGGAIRLISKVPIGDNVGHIEVTGGDYNRLDFNGAYDFSLIEDLLFARISASSKKIDGYIDRLDFVCQMNANGTPELAGSLPPSILSQEAANGNCKIGEKGGSESDAAKIMLRFVPSYKLEFNLSADYSQTVADAGPEVLVSGSDPDPPANSNDLWVQNNIIDPTWNIEPGDALTILGDTFLTGSNYSVYQTYEDPINGTRWPDKQTVESKNMSASADYDITENINIKGIFGYRQYDAMWVNLTSYGPFSFGAALEDQSHEQTSYEVRLNGMAFDNRLDWTTGIYYYESDDLYSGYKNYGTYGLAGQGLYTPIGYYRNDSFHSESESVFAHVIYKITEDLSLTTGTRYTDEEKIYQFDNPGLLTIDEPLLYGGSHYDWKLALDYNFTENIMAYAMASTGFRSEGANPRPFYPAQLQTISGEEIVAYEVGSKTQFFDNRLRVNAAVFLNKYDPRLFNAVGAQCTNPAGMDPGEYTIPYGSLCPAGTYAEGTIGVPVIAYISAPGTSKGLEFDVVARPIDNLTINSSFGYYKYETDVSQDHPGFTHPDYKYQPEYNFNIGAEYRYHFNNGSMLMPRIDMFYQGERNNGGLTTGPIEPYHVIPDYTVFNARLTYMPPNVRWSVSLEAKNLFDKFYWVHIDAERNDYGTEPIYSRTGIPSAPRMMALTFRYNFF